MRMSETTLRDRFRDSVAVVSLCLLPLAATLVAGKLHKLVSMTGGLDPVHAARVVAPELLLLLLIGLGWSLIRRLGPAAARVIADVLFGAISAILGAVAVLEHGYFVVTGSFLDWDTAVFGLSQWTQIREVVLAATPGWVIVLLAGQAAWVATVLAASPFSRVRSWLFRPSGRRRPIRSTFAIAAVFLGLPLAGLLLPVPAPLRPLATEPFAGYLAGFLREDIPGSGAGAPALTSRDPVIVSGPDTHEYNVVFVILESVRASATSLESGGPETTPVLAALASRGLRVPEAYTVIPHTTRALPAIFCGTWPNIDPLPATLPPGAFPTDCLPILLLRRGYDTALFQSVEEEYESGRDLARNLGFSTYHGYESLPREGFDKCSYFGYEDDILLEPSLRWVDHRTGPFLLAYLTVVPHHDYRVPAGFETRQLSDDPTYNQYLNTVRYVDRFLGKVLQGFEQRGLLDRTVFVVLGDHGEAFGEHGKFQHDNVFYEEGVRIPIVMAGPGIAAGRVVPGLRQNIDVVPTVLDVLGLSVHPALEGRSLLTPQGRDAVFVSAYYPNQGMALRTGDRKIVYHFHHRPAEAFDLAADPGEKRDLAGTLIRSEEIEEAIHNLLDWKRSVDRCWADPAKRVAGRYVTRDPQPVANIADVTFGDFVRLRGWDVHPKAVEPGDVVEITLDFEVLSAPGPAWRLFVHLMEGDVHRVNADHVPVSGTTPVERWTAGDFVRDRSWVRIPPATPSGFLEIAVGFWREDIPGEIEARAIPMGSGARIDGGRRVRIMRIRVNSPSF